MRLRVANDCGVLCVKGFPRKVILLAGHQSEKQREGGLSVIRVNFSTEFDIFDLICENQPNCQRT